jgi:hypothetical protein
MLLLILIVMLALSVSPVPRAEAAPNIRATLSGPSFINGGWTFSGTLTVSNQGTSAYCVTLSVSAPSGFSIRNNRKSLFMLGPRQSASLTFNATAPRYATQGFFVGTVSWSGVSSCRDTSSSTQAFLVVTVPAPTNWQFGVTVWPAWAVKSGSVVVINLYDGNGGLFDTRALPAGRGTGPYGATFAVTGPGIYKAQASLVYCIPSNKGCGDWPASASKTIYISSNGQYVDLYPVIPMR